MKRIMNYTFWIACIIWVICFAYFVIDALFVQSFDHLFACFMAMCACTIILHVSNLILCRLKPK